MYASFRRVRGLGYMTVSETLETMHDNDSCVVDCFVKKWATCECFGQIVHRNPGKKLPVRL